MMPTPVKVGDLVEYTTPRVRTPYRGRVVGLTDMAIRLDSGVVLARRVTQLKVIQEGRSMDGTNGTDGTKTGGQGAVELCPRCGVNPWPPKAPEATRRPAMCSACYAEAGKAGAKTRAAKSRQQDGKQAPGPAVDAPPPVAPSPFVPTGRTTAEDLVRHALTMFLAEAEPRLLELEALRDKVARAKDLAAILDRKVA